MATRRRSPSNQNIMSHYKPDFDLQTSESVLKCLLYSFFEVSWQLLRVEASAKSERNEKRASINAPLRLITSGGEIRIALKKNSGGWFKFQVFFKSFFSRWISSTCTNIDKIRWNPMGGNSSTIEISTCVLQLCTVFGENIEWKRQSSIIRI